MCSSRGKRSPSDASAPKLTDLQLDSGVENHASLMKTGLIERGIFYRYGPAKSVQIESSFRMLARVLICAPNIK
ncbi:MAG: hypothetical protein EAZ24_04190 [Burkholderiales bacterium]|nr:MAG: hypothetical protein EAZ24_04190 [Burkholderiales bacterium]